MAGKGGKTLGTEARAVASDAVEASSRALGKTGIEEASNQIFKAVKPTLTVKRNKKTIRDVMNMANEELFNRGYSPKSLKEYSENIGQAKKSLWTEIESKLSSDKVSKGKC